MNGYIRVFESISKSDDKSDGKLISLGQNKDSLIYLIEFPIKFNPYKDPLKFEGWESKTYFRPLE